MNDLEKNLLLRLATGVVLMATGFYSMLLLSTWCFNWLLEAFQTINNNPMMNLADIDKTPLVLNLALIIGGLILIIYGTGIILGIRRQSA